MARFEKVVVGIAAVLAFVGVVTYGSTPACFGFFGISAGLFLLLIAVDVLTA